MELKAIINDSLKRSISPEDYQFLLVDYANSSKTSGPDQKEDLIQYTKLNAQRSKRVMKTTAFLAELTEMIQTLPKQTWLLITETWCGDAANSVPVIIKLAALNPAIDLRILLRDENPMLMDQFLTKGGRSIPKLIALNESSDVLFTWGPRPEELQEIYWEWRNAADSMPYSEFHLVIQKWYNENKSEAIQQELLKLLRFS